MRHPHLQKGVVEQLPKKVDQIVFCELRPSQKRAYARVIASPDVQVGLPGLQCVLGFEYRFLSVTIQPFQSLLLSPFVPFCVFLCLPCTSPPIYLSGPLCAPSCPPLPPPQKHAHAHANTLFLSAIPGPCHPSYTHPIPYPSPPRPWSTPTRPVTALAQPSPVPSAATSLCFPRMVVSCGRTTTCVTATTPTASTTSRRGVRSTT